MGVRAWLNARRREREAHYKGEAMKKIAEMQGAAPEPVLALLREALTAGAAFANGSVHDSRTHS